MSKSKSKSKSKSRFTSKSKNKIASQHIEDINKIQELLNIAINQNELQSGQKISIELDANMLEKIKFQFQRLAAYEDKQESEIKRNQEVNKQLSDLQNHIDKITKENKKLVEGCEALKGQLNQYKNAIDNIKLALTTRSLEHLSGLEGENFDIAAIQDILNSIEQFLNYSKSLTQKVLSLNKKALNIGNSSEKNSGKSNNSSNSNNDEQDKGLSFSSSHQLIDQDVKDLAKLCKTGVKKSKYLLDQIEYQKKYHEQLSSVSNMDSIQALSSLIKDDTQTSNNDITDTLLNVIDDACKFVVSKAHTNGDLHESISVTIDEQIEKYSAEISGTRHSLSTKATSTTIICPLCNRKHAFKIGHVVYENIIKSLSGTKLINVLEPVYHLTSEDSECKHSFNCSLSLLDVSKVLFEEFDVSNESIQKLLSNEALSNEERLRLANEAVLNKDNSLNNPEKANGITTDVRAQVRSYKQAKNVPMSYDDSEHKKSLRDSIGKKKRNVTKFDDINNAARKTKARQIEYNSDIANVAAKHNIIEYNDTNIKVIDPNSFNYEVNGTMPLFKSVSISSEMIAIAASLKSVYAPTNASHKYIDNMVDGNEMCTRQTLNNHIVALGRVLHGVTQQSKLDIISNSSSILADETTGKVRSGINKEIKTHYVWGIRTGKTEQQQECSFEAYSSRSSESCISFLKPLVSLRENKEAIIVKTDGYGVYNSILSNGCFADKVQHSTCLTHARRPIHKYLEDCGLSIIYNKELLPKDCKFSQFGSNLRNFLQKHPESINATDLAILIAYYLINAIFAVDGMVNEKYTDYSSVAYKNELTEARNTHSVKLLYILNKIMELLAGKLGLLIYNANSKTYKANKDLIYKDRANGVLYWLNSRNTLSNFIDSPDIELSQSGVERAIRPLAIGRRVSLWMDSYDGLSSYTNIHTTITNCMYAGVDVLDYLIWVQANIRQRTLNLMEDSCLIKKHEKEIKQLSGMPYSFNDEVLKIPSRSSIWVKEKDEEGDEYYSEYKVGVYDKRNITSAWLDLISYKGLTPKDYKALLARKK